MITTPSILLRSRDVGEADRLFTFYTRDHGKVEARAMGVRKVKSKLAGHVTEHAIIRCTFFPGQREMRLVQARREAYYHAIARDCTAYAVVAYAREAVDCMVKRGITDSIIFDLLERLFIGLERQSAAPLLLLHAFLFHFLTALGYRPASHTVKEVTVFPSLLHEHSNAPLQSEQFLVTLGTHSFSGKK